MAKCEFENFHTSMAKMNTVSMEVTSEEQIVSLAVEMYDKDIYTVSRIIFRSMRAGQGKLEKILSYVPENRIDHAAAAISTLFFEIAPNAVRMSLEQGGTGFLSLPHERENKFAGPAELRDAYCDFLQSEGYTDLVVAIREMRNDLGHHTLPALLASSPMNGNVLAILIDRLCPPEWEKLNSDFLSQTIVTAANLRGIPLHSPAWSPEMGRHFINAAEEVLAESDPRLDDMDEDDVPEEMDTSRNDEGIAFPA